jgi:uncharacterized protein (UPF0332 family)
MTPEAADYLEKARGDLADSRKIAGMGLARVAARLAYYGAFHAAEALIVDRSDKKPKTHSGVRAEFGRLLKDKPDVAREMLGYLARAYAYKQTGDYAVGRDATITQQQADEAIEDADRLIARVSTMLGPPG